MPLKDVFDLLDAIHLSLMRPEFQPQPEVGTTHCNQYVSEVCEAYVMIKVFEGMLANEMIDYLASSPNWSEIPMEKCQDLANAGSLIIAGLKADPHGHVNIICPGKSKSSGRWGVVPSCANVGKDVFIGKGINWAFTDLPKFYGWRPTLA